MLEGKHILLGVTGGIAAYKACELASLLMKSRAHVDVIMTDHATKFVTPNTFEALTHTKAVTDTFDRLHWKLSISHLPKADRLLFDLATANIISKTALGTPRTCCDHILAVSVRNRRARTSMSHREV
jgi:phosphopantothenoylcysteine decarboxylase/phosphopantothenate--cysteine ligase